jgi:hypothetical protein
VADIDGLAQQHDEIAALLKKLTNHEDDRDIMDNAMGLSLTLGKLAGKMYLHILTEERILYPALLSLRNESVRETCKKYSTAMDNIVQRFRRYRAAYSSAGKIFAHPAAFRYRTTAIANILIQRFEDEQLVLYPILERLCRDYYDL